MRFSIALVSIIASLGALKAGVQDLAPIVLPNDTILILDGTYVEGIYHGPESAELGIRSSDSFTGDFSYNHDAPGTFSYTKTSSEAATFSYTWESDQWWIGSENSSISLIFTSPSGGTYTRTAFYENGGGDHPYHSGNFTGSGTFHLVSPGPSTASTLADDFDDNLRDSSKWAEDMNWPEDNGTLAEVNQRLEYILEDSGGHASKRTWGSDAMTYDRDWEVVVDAANLALPSAPPGFFECGLGLEIGTPGYPWRLVRFGLLKKREEDGTITSYFELRPSRDGQPIQVLPTSSTAASLRITFSAKEKILRFYQDSNGPEDGLTWTLLGHFGINPASDEDEREDEADWLMEGSDEFQISLFSFDENTTVESGVIYFDNFRITPSISTPIPISDNFSDNSQDVFKWGEDFVPDSEEEGNFSEINQRMEYTGGPDFNRDLRLPWILNPPSSTRDWELVVQVYNSARAYQSAGDTGVGVEVSPSGTSTKYVRQCFLARGSEEEGYPPRIFSSVIDGGVAIENARSSKRGVLRIAYTAASKVLTTYYDPDGPTNGYSWIKQSSFGLAGTGGENGNSSWDLSPTSTFQISLYGFNREMIAERGRLYLDNFCLLQEDSETSLIENWRQHHLGADGADRGNLDDFDKDGIPNVLEFAFSLDPKISNRSVLSQEPQSVGLPAIRPEGTGSNRRLVIDFIRRKASTNPGITYQPQFSGDLSDAGAGGWQDSSGTEIVTSIDAEWERVTVQDTSLGAGRRFGRVKVITP